MEVSTFVNNTFNGVFEQPEDAFLVVRKTPNVQAPVRKIRGQKPRMVYPTDEPFTLEVDHLSVAPVVFWTKDGVLKTQNEESMADPGTEFQMASVLVDFLANATKISSAILENPDLPEFPAKVVKYWESDDDSTSFAPGRFQEDWVWIREKEETVTSGGKTRTKQITTMNPEAEELSERIGQGQLSPGDVTFEIETDWDYTSEENGTEKLLKALKGNLDVQVPFRKWTFINPDGANPDHRGTHPMDWVFEFQPEITVEADKGEFLTVRELAKALPWVRSHKLDQHYEWIIGVEFIELLEEDEIKVTLSIDHGS